MRPPIRSRRHAMDGIVHESTVTMIASKSVSKSSVSSQASATCSSMLLVVFPEFDALRASAA